MYSYNDKTVLVVGATAGIGRAIAIAFGQAGANLVLVGRDAARGASLLAELRKSSIPAKFVQGSISDEAVARGAVDMAIEQFGSLDIAINNAGIFEPEMTPLHEKSAAQFDAVFDINVKGLFFSLKHQLAAMLPKQAGVIVNVSSVAGGQGGAMLSLYSSSKHAVEGMTKAAALEAAPSGVRVLMVRPHAVETAMIDALVGKGETEARQQLRSTVPLGRLGKVEEQARAMLFLCSNDASYITGSAVCVDGGYHAG